MNLSKYFGPSTLVAAAFIGPGTLTTCTIAGVRSGYTLLWALLFSIVATIILQEMAARLGYVSKSGLGEAINHQFPKGVNRIIVFFLVIGSIIIGNAAYEAGNISGGVMGMDLLLGEFHLWPLIIGCIGFAILFFGGYKWLEKILIALVITMSFCFLITAVLVSPEPLDVLRGFLPSTVNDTNYLLILGLIGTTIVPYNLFLHASTISRKYNQVNALSDIRKENIVAIMMGGIISMLIIITAAASQEKISDVQSAADLAVQLQPLFGNGAKYCMGIGLMAAGLSSALTAPIAAAYAARGLFGWDDNDRDKKFRAVWIIILLIGVVVATTGIKPILIIKFAQITNAILLPFIAIYLIYISNDKKVLGRYTNGWISNLLSIAVVIITLLLSLKSLSSFL